MKTLFATLICLMLLGCGSDSRDKPQQGTKVVEPTTEAEPFVWNESNWDEADWQ